MPQGKFSWHSIRRHWLQNIEYEENNQIIYVHSRGIYFGQPENPLPPALKTARQISSKFSQFSAAAEDAHPLGRILFQLRSFWHIARENLTTFFKKLKFATRKYVVPNMYTKNNKKK